MVYLLLTRCTQVVFRKMSTDLVSGHWPGSSQDTSMKVTPLVSLSMLTAVGRKCGGPRGVQTWTNHSAAWGHVTLSSQSEARHSSCSLLGERMVPRTHHHLTAHCAVHRGQSRYLGFYILLHFVRIKICSRYLEIRSIVCNLQSMVNATQRNVASQAKRHDMIDQ